MKMWLKKRNAIPLGGAAKVAPLIIDGLSFWYFLTTDFGSFSANPGQPPDFAARWPNIPAKSASNCFSSAANEGQPLNAYFSDPKGPWNIYSPKWLPKAYEIFGTAIDANALARIWLLLVTRGDFSDSRQKIADPTDFAKLITEIVPSHPVTSMQAHDLLYPTITVPFGNTINSFGALSMALAIKDWQGGGSHPTPGELLAANPADQDLGGTR